LPSADVVLRQVIADRVPRQLRSDIDVPFALGRMAGMRAAIERGGRNTNRQN
jgi:hypothetical protein